MNAKVMKLWDALEAVGYVSGGYDHEKDMITICKPDPFAPDGYAVVGWMNDTSGEIHFPQVIDVTVDVPLLHESEPEEKTGDSYSVDDDSYMNDFPLRMACLAFDAGVLDEKGEICVEDFRKLRDVILDLVRSKVDDKEADMELKRMFKRGW